MKVVRMKAERRTALGRNQVAQLRKEGWLPAVVYGESQDTQPIAISEWEMEQQSAMLHEVSFHATTDRPVHVDFKRIDLTKPTEAELEVTLIGHPVGLGKGGVLSKDHMVVRISCLPTSIPEGLEHDISALDVGDTLTAGQLSLPAGVTLVSPAHLSVCHVAAMKLDQKTAAAEAAPADAKPAS